jgi:hypothetical protein
MNEPFRMGSAAGLHSCCHNPKTGTGLDRKMLKIFATAALAAALLASGAYAPEAISAQTDNVTVIKKNQTWFLPRQIEELCDFSCGQSV